MGTKEYEEKKTLTQEEINRLDSGKPIGVKKGLSIQHNPSTGLYEGVPMEWPKGYSDLPFKVDTTKTVKTKHLSQEIRPEYDFPETILEFINTMPIVSSKPTNFRHVIHLQVDLNS